MMLPWEQKRWRNNPLFGNGKTDQFRDGRCQGQLRSAGKAKFRHWQSRKPAPGEINQSWDR